MQKENWEKLLYEGSPNALLFLYGPQKQPCHKIADKPASGEGEHPREQNISHHRKTHGGQSACGATAHYGGGFRVRCADGNAKQRATNQTKRRRNIGTKALMWRERHHI